MVIVLATALLGGCAGASTPEASTSSGSAEGDSSATPAAFDEVDDSALTCRMDGDVALGTDTQAEALVYGTGPAVILIPQYGYSICTMDAFGRAIAAEGYRVAVTDADASDPVAVVVSTAGWMTAQGATKVGLIGTSRGGTIAIAAAPKVDPAVVISLSGPSAFQGIDALSAIPKVTAPILLIAGAQDEQQFVDAANALAAARPTPPVELHIIDGSDGHGVNFLEPNAPERTLVMDALAKNLAP